MGRSIACCVTPSAGAAGDRPLSPAGAAAAKPEPIDEGVATVRLAHVRLTDGNVAGFARGKSQPGLAGERNGRSGRIRTCDPRVPNAVLYQTEPHSDLGAGLIGEHFQGRKKPIGALHPEGLRAISLPSRGPPL